jgi:imidazolonepropionase-like amidohydrolase
MTPKSLRMSSLLFASIVLIAALAFEPSRAQTPPGGIVAITGARVIDGTGAAPIEQATVVVGANGHIQAVGAAGSVQVPAGATRVDLSGKTIIPGMINSHAHLNYFKEMGGPVREQLIRRLRTYAEYGVTSAVSLGSTEADELDGIKLRDEQSQGTLDRARIYTGGLNAVGKTPEDARKSVDRLADLRVDIIKFHINGTPNDMNQETWSAIIDESHKKGLRTAVHIFYLKDAQASIDKGVDVIAHSVRDQPVTPQLINSFKTKNIGYIPTITRDLSVFVYETKPAFFDDPFFRRGMGIYRQEVETLSDPARQEKVRSDQQAQAIKPAMEQGMKNLKTLSDAGVTIAMGTDSGAQGNPGRWQGYFEHVELEYMTKAGMTPMQTIVAATSGAAKVMKLADVGSIQSGKQADLLVLNANPLTDIKNTRQIHSVWIGGRQLTGVAAK